jgi:hypothetical protein
MSSPVNCNPEGLAALTIEQGAFPEKPRCSVKEAAIRLRKSASSVYRMRRRPGPLQFILDGRRIYVEMDSLEAVLSTYSQATNCVGTPLVSDGGGVDAIAAETDPDPGRAGAGASNQPLANGDAIGRSGQRDLIIPPQQRTLLILYMA